MARQGLGAAGRKKGVGLTHPAPAPQGGRVWHFLDLEAHPTGDAIVSRSLLCTEQKQRVGAEEKMFCSPLRSLPQNFRVSTGTGAGREEIDGN